MERDSLTLVGIEITESIGDIVAKAAEKNPASGLENASISKAVYKDGKWKLKSSV
ncbi:MAG: hypothetical protein ACLTXM_12510 [Enterococcus sp.]|uniref:hypothetical protein n=1 Tax=Enterococcus raffinosus TaxID=71452 RepID=UPI001C11194F|nr:hypothetical protein [Enterococcus raffinosus]MBU5363570.1 hypothetical protein [Enterococcus raffinosus]